MNTHYVVKSGNFGYMDAVSVHNTRRAAERAAAWEVRELRSCLNDPHYTGNDEDGRDPLVARHGYSFRHDGYRILENRRSIIRVSIIDCDCGNAESHIG